MVELKDRGNDNLIQAFNNPITYVEVNGSVSNKK